MRYSVEPRDRINLKGYGFLSFAKNMNNKHSQKIFDTTKNSTTDAMVTAPKRAIQKTAEATGFLIGNKIADKIKIVSIKSPKELQSQNEEKT